MQKLDPGIALALWILCAGFGLFIYAGVPWLATEGTLTSPEPPQRTIELPGEPDAYAYTTGTGHLLVMPPELVCYPSTIAAGDPEPAAEKLIAITSLAAVILARLGLVVWPITGFMLLRKVGWAGRIGLVFLVFTFIIISLALMAPVAECPGVLMSLEYVPDPADAYERDRTWSYSISSARLFAAGPLLSLTVVVLPVVAVWWSREQLPEPERRWSFAMSRANPNITALITVMVLALCVAVSPERYSPPWLLVDGYTQLTRTTSAVPIRPEERFTDSPAVHDGAIFTEFCRLIPEYAEGQPQSLASAAQTLGTVIQLLRAAVWLLVGISVWRRAGLYDGFAIVIFASIAVILFWGLTSPSRGCPHTWPTYELVTRVTSAKFALAGPLYALALAVLPLASLWWTRAGDKAEAQSEIVNE